MAPRIETISESLIRVIRDDGTYTGINTGIRVNSPTLRKLAGKQREPGWIIRDGKMTRWDPVSLVESDGRIFVYGPAVTGRFLAEIVDDESAEVLDRLSVLRDVAAAYATLEKNQIEIQPINTRAIMIVEDGVFLLPADLTRAIREHQDTAEALRYASRLTHPDKSAVDNVGHFIAVAAYRILTGEYPFDGEDSEELHARIRAGEPVPALLKRLTLREDVSEQVSHPLESEARPPGAQDWVGVLDGWIRDGVDQERTTEELEKLRERSRKESRRIQRGFSRKQKVRKHWRTGVIVAIVAVAVLWVPGTILRNALLPPLTAGMDATQVVTNFYASIGKLDHEFMSDATARGVANNLIRQVTTLFVVERQRQGMALEQQVAMPDQLQTNASTTSSGGLIDAQTWRDAGMPALSNGTAPYGVANLNLEVLQSDPDLWRFRATYESWQPVFPAEGQPAPDPGYQAFSVVDELSLRPFRDTWQIFRIDEISSTPIDLAALGANR